MRKKPTPPVAPVVVKVDFKLKFTPVGDRQRNVLKAWKDGKDIMMTGYPGTGKTYVAVALALTELMKANSTYDKIVIIRSFVPSRDMGFLKGGPKEKGEVYEGPYIGLCAELTGDKDAYAKFVTAGKIVFESTAFQRGNTISNAIMVCDEVQNYDWQETKTVFTRVGKNTRVIACGDAKQDDITSERYHTESGIRKLSAVINHMDHRFETVEFIIDDILRSGFVKDFIIATDELGY